MTVLERILGIHRKLSLSEQEIEAVDSCEVEHIPARPRSIFDSLIPLMCNLCSEQIGWQWKFNNNHMVVVCSSCKDAAKRAAETPVRGEASG